MARLRAEEVQGMFWLTRNGSLSRAFFGRTDYFVHVRRFAFWAICAVLLGVVIGLGSVALPPTGVFGIVAVFFLLLLWTLPELRIVSPGYIRGAFLVMLVVYICIPSYYTIQVGGLPWISVRRVATAAFAVPFLLALATSHAIRANLLAKLGQAKTLSISACGFLVAIGMSVLSSLSPPESLASFVDACLTWYVPLIGSIYYCNNFNDIKRIVVLICLCSTVVFSLAILEFFTHHRLVMDVFPKSLLDRLMEQNPSIYRMIHMNPFRNGMYRASSVFGESLSLAEFTVVTIPLSLYLILEAGGGRRVALGSITFALAILTIFSSGARGGYISFLGSMVVFVAAYAARESMRPTRSLIPALTSVVGLCSFGSIAGLVMFWRRAHNIVLGGGMEEYSTQGRFDQWSAGWPHILSNPLTGHGFNLAADIIRWGDSVDSYPLSLLVETGVPSLLFFCVVVLWPIYLGIKRYLRGKNESDALAGAFAFSFTAFAIYRLVLSQHENHTLFFMLLGAAISLSGSAQSQVAVQTSELKRPAKQGFTPSYGIAIR